MIKFINREQLYKQVWSEPFTKLAPKHNVSATELRKLCNKFLIPLPKQGHWQRIAFGHNIKTPILPKYNTLTLLVVQNNRDLKNITNKLAIKVKSSIEPLSKKYEITVKKTLSRPHLIIAKTRDQLKSRKPDEYGMLHSGNGGFDMRISQKQSIHVLRVLDALIKWFEKEGYTVDVFNRYGTYVQVDGEEIQIAVEEKSNITKTTIVNNGYWDQTIREYTPSGKVSLMIKSYVGNMRQTWSAGKLYTLEELLPSFIEAIFKYAAVKKENRLLREQEEKDQEKARLERVYKEKCEILEQEKVKELEQQVKDWHFTMQLQNYISAVEEKAKVNNEEIPLETMKWLEWARRHLDNRNPLKDGLPTYRTSEDIISFEDIV
ncbi:hypothetical protein [Sulfurimonas sp.]|uniref:hypothetical protein n=1 Tax=Sulfurimonas sp. TaxID=2022749 RepID=UPI003569D1A3